MFRRRSVSIMDIPLIEPEPGQEFPFGQQDGETKEPPPAPPTPGQLQELYGRKKKKVVACAGIAVLGLVIVGAVILVAVKQSRSRKATETDRQRYFTNTVAPSTMAEPQSSTSTSIPPLSTTLSTEEHDKFQSKLIALYKIVPKCNEKEKIGEYLEFDCELIGEATPENIDTLIKELTPKIKEARFGEDSGSLNGLKEIMDKLETTTNTHHMSYATVTVESTFH